MVCPIRVGKELFNVLVPFVGGLVGEELLDRIGVGEFAGGVEGSPADEFAVRAGRGNEETEFLVAGVVESVDFVVDWKFGVSGCGE